MQGMCDRNISKRYLRDTSDIDRNPQENNKMKSCQDQKISFEVKSSAPAVLAVNDSAEQHIFLTPRFTSKNKIPLKILEDNRAALKCGSPLFAENKIQVPIKFLKDNSGGIEVLLTVGWQTEELQGMELEGRLVSNNIHREMYADSLININCLSLASFDNN
ncbi:hypothetical protein SUGI_0305200 [Cryptomeria japonica]|nr:hypothetical protein SUGI_0305200 [Cryptomeria japonica]